MSAATASCGWRPSSRLLASWGTGPHRRPAPSSCCTAGAPTSSTSLPLLDELDPERRLVAVTLRAPLQLGPVGYHWYVCASSATRIPRTFLDTYERVGAWLDELPALTGVGLERNGAGRLLAGRRHGVRARPRDAAGRRRRRSSP